MQRIPMAMESGLGPFAACYARIEHFQLFAQTSGPHGNTAYD
jgi:hypothetical protein